MFVCDVCGREEELYGETDDSPEDFDFIKCENGHLFCVNEVLNDKIKETFYNRRNLGYHVDINGEKIFVHEVPEKYCPICSQKENMQFIPDVDFHLYLKKMKYDKSIRNEIRKKFNTYKDFLNFIEKDNYYEN